MTGHRASASVATSLDDGGRPRYSTLRCAPPLTFRPTPHGLVWIGTAAGPIGGDVLHLTVEVGDGAELRVSSAAAALVLPGPGGQTSSFSTEVAVGPDASIVWRPEPTVIAGGARHRAETTLRWHTGADVVWVDELVLGRHEEKTGRITSRLVADGPAGPVLRAGFDTTGPEWDGPAGTAGARVVTQILLAGRPATRLLATPKNGPHVATLALPHDAVLVSSVATSTVTSRAIVDDVVATALSAAGRGESVGHGPNETPLHIRREPALTGGCVGWV